MPWLTWLRTASKAKDARPGRPASSNHRLSLLAVAAVSALYLPADSARAEAAVALSWRLGMIAVLLLAAAFQSARRPRASRLLLHLAALASGVAEVAIIQVAGGSTGPSFGLLLALPLIVLVLVPELPWAGALAGAATVPGGALTLLQEGRGLSDASEWACLSTAVTSLAVMGAIGFRRVWLSELRAQRERAEALERLSHADRLAMVGTLAAGVAHEINNPLSYLASNIRCALGGLPEVLPPASSPEVEEILDALRDAELGARRIERIVKDLKLMSRGPTTDEVGPVDLRAVLEGATTIAASEVRQRARLISELAEVPRVMGNESRLGQVFLNLLVNAAQSIPQGSPAAHRVTVRCGCAGGWVSAEVSDTGHGIQPGHRTRLFEPFFTTKPPGEGTGLGLYLSMSTVRGYGGSIEVESEVGQGTTFRVLLAPAEADARPGGAPAATRARAAEDAGSGCRPLAAAAGRR
jgi:signal transduction histidine kinase